MCTTTNETETLENEDPVVEEPTTETPRDINTLLALETYQGMTDEEINLILDYKIRHAVSDRELLARIAAITQREEQELADNRASSQMVISLLQSWLGQEVTISPVVQPETVSPRIVEV